MVQLAEWANAHSHWAAPVKERVAAPRLHVMALGAYAAAVLCYIIYCVWVWANYVQPVVYERQESSVHDSVPLRLEIDCQDCRPFRVAWHDTEIWRLSWDYSGVPGGCASRNPERYSQELRDFCAAQNAAGSRERAPIHQYSQMPCTNFNPLMIQIPGVLLPAQDGGSVPWSVESQVSDCQAKCDTEANCHAFIWSLPWYRNDGSSRIPFGGQNVTNPLRQNNTCLLLQYDFTTLCLVDMPQPWGDHLHVYVRKPLSTTRVELADPLDRCTITSNDEAMFSQSPSPDSQLTDTTTPDKYGWVSAHLAAKILPGNLVHDTPLQFAGLLPQGPNPNYVGAASPYEGGSTDGSNYMINFDVPVCYASDDNTDSKGLQLEIINIPHHSFADPLMVGKAVVTVSGGKTFRQSNQFQPWHKNTMHLGLTIMRDPNEEVASAEPFFSNFQYDGRTDLGREEDMMGEMLELQRNAKLLLGDEYDGLSEEDAMIVDLAVATGLVSTVPIPGYGKRFAEITASDIAVWRQTVSSDFISFRASEDTWRSGLGRRSLAQAETATTTATRRRKLNGHDEWGAVNLALRLGRFADVYTKGHRYSVWDISSDVGGMSSTIVGFLGFALALFETLKELSGANNVEQPEEDADEEKQQA